MFTFSSSICQQYLFFFPISFRFGLNLLNQRIAGDFETPDGWAHIAVNLKKDEHSAVSIEVYLNGVALDTEGEAGQAIQAMEKLLSVDFILDWMTNMPQLK